MNTVSEKEAIYDAIESLYQDEAVRGRTYYADFRRGWDRLLSRALKMDECWLPQNKDSIFTVSHRYGGIDLTLDFDQLKIAEWFEKEADRRSKAIFVAKRMDRSRRGDLSFHDSVCHYDPDAPERALGEEIKNIIACALPGLPPELQIVYGNKWVDKRTGILLNRSLPFSLLNTDFVPAFLADPFQVCLYLFMMDICIIKENYQKVKDDELRKYLHVFRPSPMLAIKGIFTE